MHMGKIKILFWLVCLGGIASVAAYFFSQRSNSQLAQQLRPYTQKLASVISQVGPATKSLPIPEGQLPEVTTLTERSMEIGEHVGAVLGESVSEVEAENQPLHERAIEYGQYMYCKGIVEEYEANHDVGSPNE